MRFLKNKILKAQEALKKRQDNKPASFTSYLEAKRGRTHKIEETPFQSKTKAPKGEIITSDNDSQSQSKESITSYAGLQTCLPDTSLKNIAVNYGKTIAAFASSPLASPYLESFMRTQKSVTISEFREFARYQKTKIGGVSSLRSAMLTTEEDDEKVAECKKLFQYLGEVFVKYFSVNWIMSGRLAHKMIYLKFRGKMLRRIRNPENFTYIKEKEPIQKKRRSI